MRIKVDEDFTLNVVEEEEQKFEPSKTEILEGDEVITENANRTKESEVKVEVVTPACNPIEIIEIEDDECVEIKGADLEATFDHGKETNNNVQVDNSNIKLAIDLTKGSNSKQQNDPTSQNQETSMNVKMNLDLQQKSNLVIEFRETSRKKAPEMTGNDVNRRTCGTSTIAPNSDVSTSLSNSEPKTFSYVGNTSKRPEHSYCAATTLEQEKPKNDLQMLTRGGMSISFVQNANVTKPNSQDIDVIGKMLKWLLEEEDEEEQKKIGSALKNMLEEDDLDKARDKKNRLDKEDSKGRKSSPGVKKPGSSLQSFRKRTSSSSSFSSTSSKNSNLEKRKASQCRQIPNSSLNMEEAMRKTLVQERRNSCDPLDLSKKDKFPISSVVKNGSASATLTKSLAVSSTQYVDLTSGFEENNLALKEISVSSNTTKIARTEEKLPRKRKLEASSQEKVPEKYKCRILSSNRKSEISESLNPKMKMSSDFYVRSEGRPIKKQNVLNSARSDQSINKNMLNASTRTEDREKNSFPEKRRSEVSQNLSKSSSCQSTNQHNMLNNASTRPEDSEIRSGSVSHPQSASRLRQLVNQNMLNIASTRPEDSEMRRGSVPHNLPQSSSAASRSRQSVNQTMLNVASTWTEYREKNSFPEKRSEVPQNLPKPSSCQSINQHNMLNSVSTRSEDREKNSFSEVRSGSLPQSSSAISRSRQSVNQSMLNVASTLTAEREKNSFPEKRSEVSQNLPKSSSCQSINQHNMLNSASTRTEDREKISFSEVRSGPVSHNLPQSSSTASINQNMLNIASTRPEDSEMRRGSVLYNLPQSSSAASRSRQSVNQNMLNVASTRTEDREKNSFPEKRNEVPQNLPKPSSCQSINQHNMLNSVSTRSEDREKNSFSEVRSGSLPQSSSAISRSRQSVNQSMLNVASTRTAERGKNSFPEERSEVSQNLPKSSYQSINQHNMLNSASTRTEDREKISFSEVRSGSVSHNLTQSSSTASINQNMLNIASTRPEDSEIRSGSVPHNLPKSSRSCQSINQNILNTASTLTDNREKKNSVPQIRGDPRTFRKSSFSSTDSPKRSTPINNNVLILTPTQYNDVQNKKNLPGSSSTRIDRYERQTSTSTTSRSNQSKQNNRSIPTTRNDLNLPESSSLNERKNSSIFKSGSLQSMKQNLLNIASTQREGNDLQSKNSSFSTRAGKDEPTRSTFKSVADTTSRSRENNDLSVSRIRHNLSESFSPPRTDKNDCQRISTLKPVVDNQNGVTTSRSKQSIIEIRDVQNKKKPEPTKSSTFKSVADTTSRSCQLNIAERSDLSVSTGTDRSECKRRSTLKPVVDSQNGVTTSRSKQSIGDKNDVQNKPTKSSTFKSVADTTSRSYQLNVVAAQIENRVKNDLSVLRIRSKPSFSSKRTHRSDKRPSTLKSVDKQNGVTISRPKQSIIENKLNTASSTRSDRHEPARSSIVKSVADTTSSSYQLNIVAAQIENREKMFKQNGVTTSRSKQSIISNKLNIASTHTENKLTRTDRQSSTFKSVVFTTSRSYQSVNQNTTQIDSVPRVRNESTKTYRNERKRALVHNQNGVASLNQNMLNVESTQSRQKSPTKNYKQSRAYHPNKNHNTSRRQYYPRNSERNSSAIPQLVNLIPPENMSIKSINDTYNTVQEFLKGMMNPDLNASSLGAYLGQVYASDYASRFRERFNQETNKKT